MAVVRLSQTQLAPTRGASLLANEQMKLMLHLDWDRADLLWEAAETFPGKSTEVMLDWHHLLTMQPAMLRQTLAKVPNKANLLIVLEEHEVPLLAKLRPAVEEVDPEGLYLLIFKKGDEPLFPAAPQLVESLPWTMGSIMRPSRPLHFVQVQGTPQGSQLQQAAPTPAEATAAAAATAGAPVEPMAFVAPQGRPPTWAWCCSSTRAQRQNGLQPTYGTLKLSAPEEGIKRIQITLPTAPPDMHAIQVATGELPAMLAWLQRSGAACHSIPGRAHGASRVVFHSLSGDDLGAITARWEGTPHFAVMTLGEYGGQELSPCPLVVECYSRKPLRAKLAPHMWQMVDRLLSSIGVSYSLQYTAFNKVRFGLASEECVTQFFKSGVPELQARGLFLKNERTQLLLVGDDLEEEDSTASEAGSDGSAGRGLARFAIVFDVPPWHTETQLLAALATAAPNLTSAVQLQWTPGSPVLAAWKVQGEAAAALESAILVDSETGTQIGVMSQREFQADRRQRAEAAARRQQQQLEQHQQAHSSGPTGGRPNQRAYASYAAAATPTPARGARGKGKGKGRAGGRRQVPTSLLGPQHY